MDADKSRKLGKGKQKMPFLETSGKMKSGAALFELWLTNYASTFKRDAGASDGLWDSLCPLRFQITQNWKHSLHINMNIHFPSPQCHPILLAANAAPTSAADPKAEAHWNVALWRVDSRYARYTILTISYVYFSTTSYSRNFWGGRSFSFDSSCLFSSAAAILPSYDIEYWVVFLV